MLNRSERFLDSLCLSLFRFLSTPVVYYGFPSDADASKTYCKGKKPVESKNERQVRLINLRLDVFYTFLKPDI